jgi:hypothetical protein
VEHVVLCLNRQLTPSLFGTFLSWVVVEHLGLDLNFESVLVNYWMHNELASAHTDSVLISHRSSPTIFLFAPFQSRPLGKQLLSILHSCDCPSIKETDNLVQKKYYIGQEHKLWRKNYDDPGIPLARFDLTLSCTWCGQKWELNSSK